MLKWAIIWIMIFLKKFYNENLVYSTGTWQFNIILEVRIIMTQKEFINIIIPSECT